MASLPRADHPKQHSLDPAARLQPQHVNPVEHVWEELREKYFHNRFFSSLDLLTDELCRGLNELTDDNERLRSLMSFPHLKVLA